jgi:hypothetical protein
MTQWHVFQLRWPSPKQNNIFNAQNLRLRHLNIFQCFQQLVTSQRRRVSRRVIRCKAGLAGKGNAPPPPVFKPWRHLFFLEIWPGPPTQWESYCSDYKERKNTKTNFWKKWHRRSALQRKKRFCFDSNTKS